ncbi:unnamed protein product [Microthlaspi erraticum]|nr:unnamed protein product [Microthlaspi erraticum]
MEFVETKYPHDDTMKELGIFVDVELVLTNMHLAKFLSYRMESYKDLTCESLASLRYHTYRKVERRDLERGLGWITFTADGVEREVTFMHLEVLFGFNYGEGTEWSFDKNDLQGVWITIADAVYSSLRSKAAQIRSPVLRYVHKALTNSFFARKTTCTITEGELQMLDMGLKTILPFMRNGKHIHGDTSDTETLIPFLDQLLNYKVTAYNNRFMSKRKLSVGGLITPILLAGGVDTTHHQSTAPGWMEIKFCKMLLPSPAYTTVREGENFDFWPPLDMLIGHEAEHQAEEQAEQAPELMEQEIQANEEVGEPDCYYFDEYEAPRMNSSVLAAHKRIGLLQKFNKWQRKAMEKMQKSMDKMVNKIKSLEKKVKGSSSKKSKATSTPPFLRSRYVLTQPRKIPAQEPPRALLYEPREAEASRQRRRRSSRTRRSDSTNKLDRAQADEPQLDRVEDQVELEEPQ